MKSDGEDGPYYAAGSLERSLSILEAFTRDRPLLTLTEVVEATGLNKTTCFRLLTVLARRNYVERDEATGQYGIGFRALQMADAYHVHTSLTEVALPVMRSLRDAVNETVMLAVRSGDYRVDIEQAESFQDVRTVMYRGQQKPLYAGAAGKALLSSLSEAEYIDYLDRVPRTKLSESTIVDRAEIIREIKRIQKRGYAESRGERSGSGGGIAVLIRTRRGQPAAALVVSVPINRFTVQLRGKIIPAVVQAGEKISQRLQGSSNPSVAA